MADFKPGDEVVCVDDTSTGGLCPPIRQHQVYSVASVSEVRGVDAYPGRSRCCVVLTGVEAPEFPFGFCALRFRKVQKRDLGAWLRQETIYDEEQRNPAPTKKRERVL